MSESLICMMYLATGFLGATSYILVTNVLWKDSVEVGRRLVLGTIAGFICFLLSAGGSNMELLATFGAGYSATDFIPAIASWAKNRFSVSPPKRLNTR